MNFVEELRKEGALEQSREVAVEMLKDHMPIVKFTKLDVDEVLKLRQDISKKKKINT